MAFPTNATFQPHTTFHPNSTLRPYSSRHPNFTLHPNATLQPLVVESIYTYPELVFCAVVFSILIGLAIIGNSLVLAAVARTKKLQNVTNVFVVNLSVSDFLLSFALLWSMPGMVTKTPGYPLQSDVPCVAAGALLFIAGGCGVYTLANIALNRCILITRPKETYQWLYTPKKIAMMVLVSWFVPLCAAIIPPLSGIGALGFDPSSRTCTDVETHPQATDYNNIQVALFYLPFVVVIASYLLIWRHVSRHFKKRRQDVLKLRSASSKPSWPSSTSLLDIGDTHSSINTQSTAVSQPCPDSSRQLTRTKTDQLAITKNLFVVVLAFLICLTPIGIIVVTENNRYDLYGSIFLFLNGCINPLIYAAKHPHFAPVLRAMIRCSNNQKAQA